MEPTSMRGTRTLCLDARRLLCAVALSPQSVGVKKIFGIAAKTRQTCSLQNEQRMLSPPPRARLGKSHIRTRPPGTQKGLSQKKEKRSPFGTSKVSDTPHKIFIRKVLGVRMAVRNAIPGTDPRKIALEWRTTAWAAHPLDFVCASDNCWDLLNQPHEPTLDRPIDRFILLPKPLLKGPDPSPLAKVRTREPTGCQKLSEPCRPLWGFVGEFARVPNPKQSRAVHMPQPS